MKTGLSVLASALFVAAGIGGAAADYPERPLTFLIPFGAGGGTDAAIRTYAPYLESCLGTTIVVINRPGAGGQIGFAELANSTPDGYMISPMNVPNVQVGAITGTAYTLDQFAFLGNIVGTNVTLAVGIDSPIETLDDLIEEAGSRSTPMNLGMASVAADDHLMALRFARMADVEFTTLPLESAANVRNAIMGGHVEVGSISNTEAAPFLEQLRVLAVASTERLPGLPDTPTFRELGYDLVAASNHPLAVPADVPEEIRTRLADCIAQVAADPAFLEEAEARSISLNIMSAEETQAFVEAEEADLRALWEEDPWQ